MKQLHYLLLITLMLSFTSCKEESPILPGLLKSRIVITTVPDSAKINLNNKDLEGVTPVFADELEPGFYRIAVTRKDYIDTVLYALIQRGKEENVVIKLKENPASFWGNINKANSALPTNLLSVIVFDANDNKWIGTRGFGLVFYDNTTFTTYSTANSALPENTINSILLDQNVVWVATKGGLVKINGGDWQVYHTGNSNLPDNNITSLAVDKNGTLWIGTFSGGLVKFDRINFTVYNPSNSGMPGLQVRYISLDTSGNKWISVWGYGLVKYNNISWSLYSPFNGKLPNGYVNQVKFDNNQNLIICSGTNLDPGYFTVMNPSGNILQNFTPAQFGLTGSIFTSVAVASNNVYWLGTDRGVIRYNGTDRIVYTAATTGLKSNSVIDIAIDRNNHKWILTDGISIYYGGKD